MRILHTTQYFLPWLGYQEFYLARELLRGGHEVLVVASNLRWPVGPGIALSDGGEPHEMPVGPSVERGIPTHRLPIVWEPLVNRFVLRGLRKILRAFAPDAVHAHGYLIPMTFEVARERRRGGFSLLVDEHQLPHQAARGTLHRAARRATAALARRLILPRADHLVAVAPGARDWLIHEYGCAAERVELIPLGADTDVFRPDPAGGASLRAELGLSPQERLVVYSGKIAPVKRVDVLLEAAARLRPTPTVLAVGSAETEVLAAIEAQARRLGVPFFRRRAVAAEELARCFNAADVCVWPADCTISHLEAAACGRPIVIPDEPGIADRIAANNGLGTKVGDVQALAEKIDRILGDRDQARRMGEAGRRMVLDHFSWPAVTRRFEALYRTRRP